MFMPARARNSIPYSPVLANWALSYSNSEIYFKASIHNYQYKREPLSIEEADRLFSVADTLQEKLCVYGLLETGLRVSELAGLNKQQIQWQRGAIRIKGKGGPYGKKSKVRVIPMSRRLKPLLENFFVMNDNFPWTSRTIQRVMKRIPNKAGISKPLTPHVL